MTLIQAVRYKSGIAVAALGAAITIADLAASGSLFLAGNTGEPTAAAWLMQRLDALSKRFTAL